MAYYLHLVLLYRNLVLMCILYIYYAIYICCVYIYICIYAYTLIFGPWTLHKDGGPKDSHSHGARLGQTSNFCMFGIG
jgi:hypothetical protein